LPAKTFNHFPWQSAPPVGTPIASNGFARNRIAPSGLSLNPPSCSATPKGVAAGLAVPTTTGLSPFSWSSHPKKAFPENRRPPGEVQILQTPRLQATKPSQKPFPPSRLLRPCPDPNPKAITETALLQPSDEQVPTRQVDIPANIHPAATTSPPMENMPS